MVVWTGRGSKRRESMLHSKARAGHTALLAGISCVFLVGLLHTVLLVVLPLASTPATALPTAPGVAQQSSQKSNQEVPQFRKATGKSLQPMQASQHPQQIITARLDDLALAQIARRSGDFPSQRPLPERLARLDLAYKHGAGENRGLERVVRSIGPLGDSLPQHFSKDSVANPDRPTTTTTTTTATVPPSPQPPTSTTTRSTTEPRNTTTTTTTTPPSTTTTTKSSTTTTTKSSSTTTTTTIATTTANTTTTTRRPDTTQSPTTPAAGRRHKRLSGGVIFAIILVTGIMLYAVIGVALRRRKGYHGVEIIPNHPFWFRLGQTLRYRYHRTKARFMNRSESKEDEPILPRNPYTRYSTSVDVYNAHAEDADTL